MCRHPINVKKYKYSFSCEGCRNAHVPMRCLSGMTTMGTILRCSNYSRRLFTGAVMPACEGHALMCRHPINVRKYIMSLFPGMPEHARANALPVRHDNYGDYSPMLELFEGDSLLVLSCRPARQAGGRCRHPVNVRKYKYSFSCEGCRNAHVPMRCLSGMTTMGTILRCSNYSRETLY
jgi:hypothetical protein